MPHTTVQKRLHNIMDTLTHNVYNYGCTGIFEKHKLLFSFEITIKLEMDTELLRQDELDFFIKVFIFHCICFIYLAKCLFIHNICFSQYCIYLAEYLFSKLFSYQRFF